MTAVANDKKPRHYKDLLARKRSMELAKDIYVLTVNYPSTETYGLVSQMRRVAVSIPSNIAEGQATWHTRIFIVFIACERIARRVGDAIDFECGFRLLQEFRCGPDRKANSGFTENAGGNSEETFNFFPATSH